jgi:hypothetical protein
MTPRPVPLLIQSAGNRKSSAPPAFRNRDPIHEAVVPLQHFGPLEQPMNAFPQG